MKNILTIFSTKILPHICIVLSVMLLVFVCIDYINPAMQFIDNEITKTLIFVLSVLTVILSIVYMVKLYKEKK